MDTFPSSPPAAVRADLTALASALTRPALCGRPALHTGTLTDTQIELPASGSLAALGKPPRHLEALEAATSRSARGW